MYALVLQTELLIGRNSYQNVEVNSFNTTGNVGSTEISMPWEVRLVPDIWGLRIFSISWGYNPRILLNPTYTIRGAELDVPSESFEDRYQHSFFFDFAIGNILWKYGLSAGLRYHTFRESKSSLVNMDNYRMYQVYLHLNL